MVYKIPEKLFGKYDGSGYAFAEIVNDEIVNFIYLRNILRQEIVEALETDHARYFTLNA